MDKKGAGILTVPMLWLFVIVGGLIFAPTLFKIGGATSTIAGLLKNPIIILLLIVSFFLWATKK